MSEKMKIDSRIDDVPLYGQRYVDEQHRVIRRLKERVDRAERSERVHKFENEKLRAAGTVSTRILEIRKNEEVASAASKQRTAEEELTNLRFRSEQDRKELASFDSLIRHIIEGEPEVWDLIDIALDKYTRCRSIRFRVSCILNEHGRSNIRGRGRLPGHYR